MKEFQDLKDSIRTVPDYPVEGIQFRDITTLLQNKDLFTKMIDGMTKQWAGVPIDAILSIESRGFIMAGALAYNLGTAFVPLRKPEKLPYSTYSVSYDLEYGTAEIEMHIDAVKPGDKVIIHDDLLATGGTAVAAAKLIQSQGAEILGFSFVVELAFLEGRKRLEEFTSNITSIVKY